MTETGSVLVRGFQDVSREWVELAQQRLQKNTPGLEGALRMGVWHGAYCVGCCWALMLLLFVGGVMNLLWVAAIAAFVLVEKLIGISARWR